jgi:hypothetical protein
LKVGRPKKNTRAAAAILPSSDPGQDVADRWRKRFCLKGETGTIIDKEKMALALDDAKARALRIIEHETNVRPPLRKMTVAGAWHHRNRSYSRSRTVVAPAFRSRPTCHRSLAR